MPESDALKSDQANQEKLLAQAIKERKALESSSEKLEKNYDANKVVLDDLTLRLNSRMGSLKELFTHLQTATSDTSTQLQSSLTSVEMPSRYFELQELSDRLSQNRNLPRIDELEQLWYQLQREMVESGKIKHLNLDVIDTNGQTVNADVVRVGNFNLMSGNHYLQFIPETGKVIELNRQPARYMLSYVEDFTQASEGFSAVAIDPNPRGIT